MFFSSLEALLPNARWKQKGDTIAGGNGYGRERNQLTNPEGLYVDEDQTVVIADWHNNRIMEWKQGDKRGRVVAGGNMKGNGTNQLNWPTDVIVDKETDSLMICDSKNRRVMRWSRRNGTTSGEKIIDNIACRGLTMDSERNLYVTDETKHEVRQYRMGEMNGTVVAGGNGDGDGLDQLSYPGYVFVDRDYSVYVSDTRNNRVMKWVKGTKGGIVVAGGEGEGNDLTQLVWPGGVFVDGLGTVYVTDTDNHRVMRWGKEMKDGEVAVGGNGRGGQANQLNIPKGLSFDRDGNLYVVDWGNARVQRFTIEKN